MGGLKDFRSSVERTIVCAIRVGLREVCLVVALKVSHPQHLKNMRVHRNRVTLAATAALEYFGNCTAHPLSSSISNKVMIGDLDRHIRQNLLYRLRWNI